MTYSKTSYNSSIKSEPLKQLRKISLKYLQPCGGVYYYKMAAQLSSITEQWAECFNVFSKQSAVSALLVLNVALLGHCLSERVCAKWSTGTRTSSKG